MVRSLSITMSHNIEMKILYFYTIQFEKFKKECFLLGASIDIVHIGSRDHFLVITMWRPRGDPIILILNLHMFTLCFNVIKQCSGSTWKIG